MRRSVRRHRLVSGFWLFLCALGFSFVFLCDDHGACEDDAWDF